MAESILKVAERADLFFMGDSPIHETMRRLTKILADMQIPFAVAGAMAVNTHGHKRTTADFNILIHREDLVRFKERWIGLGCLVLGWVNAARVDAMAFH
jgi:hypothetical protein